MADAQALLQAGLLNADARELLGTGPLEPVVESRRHDGTRSFEDVNRSYSKGCNQLVATKGRIKAHESLGRSFVVSGCDDGRGSVTIAAGHSASTPRMLIGVAQV